MIYHCLANPDNRSVDVVITTVPWTDSEVPLMAPAVLKPIVEKTGMTCLAVDVNAEVYRATTQLQDISDHVSFFFDGVCHKIETEIWVRDALYSMAQQILSWQPRFVGISLFSYVNRTCTLWLCYFLKKMDPQVQIILGGAGCLEQFTGPSDFADDLRAKGLADFHIRGDGEQSLYELLIGNIKYVGINDTKWRQLEKTELDVLPYPDYDDYDFSFYPKRILPLQGSRGCVRKCKFCDYIENWTNFRSRTADNIFEEMLSQYSKYGIRYFKFQDTLVNGNMREFNGLTALLANHNRENPSASFHWSGFYIFRDRTSTDDLAWQVIKQSGADVLAVGIESLNQDIRFAIGKKFTNASIDYHLEKALEHNIKLVLLFITGYVTETQQHVEFSKEWLRDHVKYQPIIEMVQWGSGLGIFPNTYLDRHKDEMGIKMIGPQPHLWVNESIGSTPKKRTQWAMELNNFSRSLGYGVADYVDNHMLLEKNLNGQY